MTALATSSAISGSITNARHVAGSSSESVFQPEWAPDGTLHFISDRNGWWNLYAERSKEIVPVLEIDAEIGVPQWLFGYSRYTFLSGGRVACIYDRDGLEYLTLIDLNSKKSDAVSIPVVASGGAGRPEHLADAILVGRADAALAASIFHFGEYTIRQTKQIMADRGIPVRL